MRILLINKYFFVKGGAERALFEMDAALREAGHQTIHFALQDAHNEASPQSADFPREASFEGPIWHAATLRALGRMFYSPEVRRRLRALVRRTRPDAAVIHNAYHQLGPAVLLELAALGLPTAMVLHDYKVVCPSYTLLRDGRVCHACAGQQFGHAARYGCGGSRVRGVLLAAESYWQWDVLGTYATVGTFASPSRYLRDTLVEMGFPFPVQILRNALAMPAEPSDPTGRDAVGFAGRLSPEKGLEVLLEAAARLPAIPFRIAGDGPLGERLRRQVAERGLKHVALLGQLSTADLAREMRCWRLAAVPSVWAENCPYAVLEPMALEIPVIGTRLGGIPELLEGRGILVPPGDAGALAEAITMAWDDASRLEELGRRGRELVVRECSRASLAKALEALFCAKARMPSS